MNVSAVIATAAANAEGRREIVGSDIVTTQDTASWTEFLPLSTPKRLNSLDATPAVGTEYR